MAESPNTRTASYLAEPGEVHRVCLLYSGGLDTSVMLKWIQEQYDAEVVALTIDLGQPGEDFEIVRDKALRLGALDCIVADAKEEFAHDYVLPAIKANALYGGGYPLFTALGRPLIAKLAVAAARAHDGERLGLVELIERAGALGAKHGVGVVDHIEDRIVGLKVRDVYEVPAAALILTAHQELEKLVGTIHQNTFKPQLDNQWAFLVYAGLWYEPLLGDLNAFMDRVNEQVTGSVTLKLYKGGIRPVARSSPNALYDPELAGFGESGGLFSQQASPGFIELWSLQSRMAYGIRNRGKGET